MARPYGIVPRTVVEEAAWPALRGQIFLEAGEIFLRLLRGDVVSSDSVRSTTLTRENFRSDDDWKRVQELTVLMLMPSALIVVTCLKTFESFQTHLTEINWCS